MEQSFKSPFKTSPQSSRPLAEAVEAVLGKAGKRVLGRMNRREIYPHMAVPPNTEEMHFEVSELRIREMIEARNHVFDDAESTAREIYEEEKRIEVMGEVVRAMHVLGMDPEQTLENMEEEIRSCTQRLGQKAWPVYVEALLALGQVDRAEKILVNDVTSEDYRGSVQLAIFKYHLASKRKTEGELDAMMTELEKTAEQARYGHWGRLLKLECIGLEIERGKDPELIRQRMEDEESFAHEPKVLMALIQNFALLGDVARAKQLTSHLEHLSARLKAYAQIARYQAASSMEEAEKTILEAYAWVEDPKSMDRLSAFGDLVRVCVDLGPRNEELFRFAESVIERFDYPSQKIAQLALLARGYLNHKRIPDALTICAKIRGMIEGSFTGDTDTPQRVAALVDLAETERMLGEISEDLGRKIEQDTTKIVALYGDDTSRYEYWVARPLIRFAAVEEAVGKDPTKTLEQALKYLRLAKGISHDAGLMEAAKVQVSWGKRRAIQIERETRS